MLSYFIKGAPKSASKLSIDPINSHASDIGKSTGSNERNVTINRTMSSNWNQRVSKPIWLIVTDVPETKTLL